jgi:hypothetical protein
MQFPVLVLKQFLKGIGGCLTFFNSLIGQAVWLVCAWYLLSLVIVSMAQKG